jgi:hypothetical protein
MEAEVQSRHALSDLRDALRNDAFVLLPDGGHVRDAEICASGAGALGHPNAACSRRQFIARRGGLIDVLGRIRSAPAPTPHRCRQISRSR